MPLAPLLPDRGAGGSSVSVNAKFRMRNRLVVSAVAIVVAVLVALATRHAGDVSIESPAGVVESSSSLPPLPAKRARSRSREEFVGSAACTPCHKAESDAYFGSHHQKALASPSPETNSHFEGTHFRSELGGTTKFSVLEGAPMVNTPVAGGKAATFPIAYVSGVWPLEQYVVATERGKLQSLGVVWDSRAPDAGGGEWFHSYGPSGIAPNDTLFFTAPAQNWNHGCADCHSTLVERRYDSRDDSFDTRWAELSVGCEACHGPGREHIRAAQAATPGDAVAALAVRLLPSEPWLPSVTGSPTPRIQDGVEVEVCAPCHSRRTPIREGFLAGDPFLDSFVPDLLRTARYHADGQVEGEVYEWGSFLQSRMYQSGVRCSDCHNPHSGKTHAPGNALCGRCHEPRRFDVEAHSHHAGAAAPLCIDCHMPPTTFMQIDERRDHSIRIPRPDHSVEFGTPNACNGCHEKESATWALGWISKWAPALQKRTHFVDALGRDRKGALDAPHMLRRLVQDVAVPSIARATALERLGNYPTEKTIEALRAALGNPDPLIVYGAVLGVAELQEPQRLPLLLPVLEHEIRAVRIAAGKALAGVPALKLPASARGALERAYVEVEQSFGVSASWAETQVERSAFELARGKLKDAENALKTALRLQPCHVEAYLNLADLERQRGDEAAAERALRAAIECNPRFAAAHHALGLWQVRAHQSKAAILSLKRAVELAPNDARFSYVLAVALAGSGGRDEAIRLLERTLDHHPSDVAALRALTGYLSEAGQSQRAAETRRKLDALLRD